MAEAESLSFPENPSHQSDGSSNNKPAHPVIIPRRKTIKNISPNNGAVVNQNDGSSANENSSNSDFNTVKPHEIRDKPAVDECENGGATEEVAVVFAEQDEKISNLENADLYAKINHGVSPKQPKPASRAHSLPPNQNFKRITVGTSNNSAQSAKMGDDTDLNNSVETNKSTENKAQTHHKPLPRPRHNPPNKPKSIPPPRPAVTHSKSFNVKSRENLALTPGKKSTSPASKHSSELNISVSPSASKPSSIEGSSTVSTTPSQNVNDSNQSNSISISAKAVSRSASKAMDLLKKKSLQIKEKSLNMLKSPADSSEVETIKREDACKTPTTAISAESKNTKNVGKSPAEPKVSVQRSCSERKAPPPRPALPSVLKIRRPSEVAEGSTLSLSSKTIATNYEADETEMDTKTSTDVNISPTNSNKAGDSLLKTSEKLDADSGSCDKNSVTEIMQDTDKSISNLTKPSLKPARPPPIKFNSSHEDALSTKKPGKNEEAPEENSLLELLQKKSDAEKAKAKVDTQMRDYIFNESYCVAMQDYNAENFTDISFKAGEKVLVLRKLDDDLFYGRNEDGEEGPFPGKYVSS